MSLIIEWAFGYGAVKIADRLFAAAGGGVLQAEIEATSEAWRTGLPEHARLDTIHALLPGRAAEYELDARPALAALRRDIAEPRLPSLERWTEALMEQWRAVRRDIRDPQPFFQLPEAEAAELVAGLSSRLRSATERHQRFFATEALSIMRQMLADIQRLEKGLRQSAGQSQHPLVQTVIEWAETMSAIAPLYRRAMDMGGAWPGNASDIVREEHRLYLSIQAELECHEPRPDRVFEQVAELRDMPAEYSEQWHHALRALVASVARLRSD